MLFLLILAAGIGTCTGVVLLARQNLRLNRKLEESELIRLELEQTLDRTKLLEAFKFIDASTEQLNERSLK